MKNIVYKESQKAGDTVLYICYIYGDYTEQEKEKAYIDFTEEMYQQYGDNIGFASSNLSPSCCYDDDDE